MKNSLNISILPDEFLLPQEEAREKTLVSYLIENNIDFIPVLQELIKFDASPQIRFIAKKALYTLKENCSYINYNKGVFFEEKIVSRDDIRRFEKFLPYLLSISPYTAVSALNAGIQIDSPVLPEYLRQFAQELISSDCPPCLNMPGLNSLSAGKNDINYNDTDIYLLFKIIRFFSFKGSRKDLVLIKKICSKFNDNRLLAAFAEACALLGNQEDIPDIINLLLNKNALVKASALISLKKFGPYRIFKIIDEMLEKDDPWPREAAAFALSRLKDIKALPRLASLLSNNAQSVRLRAYEGIKILAALKVRTAIKIYKALKDKEITSHEFHLEALKWKSFSDPAMENRQKPFNKNTQNDSVKSIRQDLNESDPEIRSAAVTDIIKNSDLEKSLKLDLLVFRLPHEQDTRIVSQIMSGLSTLKADKGLSKIIIPYLMHSDSRVRANAAEALALTEPDPRVLEKNLLPLLNDPSNRVKANVLLALKNSSHPVLKDSLIKLAQGDEDHKLSAIYVISESDNPDNLDLLVQLKKSENQKISSRAGQALILIYCSFFSNKNELDYEKEKKYRQALLKAQINPDDLFDSVNKCGKKEIINKITLDRALFDLSSNNPGKRVSAIRILQFLNARAWVEKIKNFIDDPEQAVRYYARKALNSMGFFKDSAAQRSHYESIVSEPFELFKQKIVSPDPAVRLHTLDKAFTAAKTYGIEPVAAFLLENLKNEKSTFVLPSYIRQLGILAGKKALPEILPFLSNKDSRVRAFSVEAVQACRDEKALLLLMPLLDDEDNRVRANAVMALYHLEPAKALDTLDKMIYSHQPWMKESAVFVARKLGGPKIISALFEAFKYSKSYDLQIKLVRALADLQDISIIRDALEFQQVCKDKRSLLILEFLINSLSGKKEELNLKKIFHAHALGNGIDNSLIPESLIMNQPPDLRSLLESLNTFDEDIKINALKELAAKNNPALEQVFQSVYLKEKNFFLKSLSLHLMHTLFSQS